MEGQCLALGVSLTKEIVIHRVIIDHKLGLSLTQKCLILSGITYFTKAYVLWINTGYR